MGDGPVTPSPRTERPRKVTPWSRPSTRSNHQRDPQTCLSVSHFRMFTRSEVLELFQWAVSKPVSSSQVSSPHSPQPVSPLKSSPLTRRKSQKRPPSPPLRPVRSDWLHHHPKKALQIASTNVATTTNHQIEVSSYSVV